MALASDTRHRLVEALKGQTMRVPDFEKLFEGWPRARSPHLEWLRVEVDQFLQECVLHQAEALN